MPAGAPRPHLLKKVDENFVIATLFHRSFDAILTHSTPHKPCLATFDVFAFILRRSTPAGAYPLSDVRCIRSHFASPFATAGSAAGATRRKKRPPEGERFLFCFYGYLP